MTTCERYISAARTLQGALEKSRCGRWSQTELAAAIHDLDLAHADFVATLIEAKRRASQLVFYGHGRYAGIPERPLPPGGGRHH